MLRPRDDPVSGGGEEAVLQEDHGGAGLVSGGDAVEGEDVAVLSDHLVSLGREAGLQDHPVSGLAVLLPVLRPGGDLIGVEGESQDTGLTPAEQ